MGFRNRVLSAKGVTLFKKAALAVPLSLLMGSLPAKAEGPRPTFRSNPIKVSHPAGAPFTEPLKSYLVDLGAGEPFLWGVFGHPSWISLSSTTGVMTGNPTAAHVGVHKFEVSVKDKQDAGNIVGFEVTIFSVPQWTGPVDLGKIPEQTDFNFDLNTVVKDPAGKPLKFHLNPANGFPSSWLSLSPDGKLTGRPLRKDVGVFSGFSFVATSESGGQAAVSGKGEVLKVFKGPKWNALALPDATEDIEYIQDLSRFVAYTEPEPLTFKVLSGTNHSWVPVSPAGQLRGIPRRVNGGTVTLRLEVSVTYEGVLHRDEATVQFKVNLVNKPPIWSLNPIVLPDAFTRAAYGPHDLKGFVSDIDGNLKTITLVAGSGPPWGSIAANGTFSGTPQNANLGLNEWTAEAFDGEFKVPVRIQVRVRNRPPTWKTKPVNLASATEDSLYKAPLIPHATDPESDPLIFTILSGSPTWASINASGELEGTPRRTDIGLQVFRIRVSDDLSGGFDETEVRVQVNKINKPPQWTQDEITLPNAPERSRYEQSLAGFVTDPDGDTLRFEKLEGPAWASIDRDGKITGTPQRPDVGLGTFKVKVSDPGSLSDEAIVFVTVLKVNRTPLCQSPAVLVDGLQDAPYNESVSRFLSDPDLDALTIVPVSQPSWMTVGADGKLSGTPKETDITEKFTVELDARDPDGASCRLVAEGKVKRANWPPEIKAPILFTVKEREVLSENLADPRYVEDKDGEALTFSLLTAAPWVMLAPNGRLTASPQFAQIGSHPFQFSVTDGKAVVQGSFTIDVLKNPRPPRWLENPIRFTATAGQSFSANIRSKVVDDDGLPVRILRVSGPGWLTIGEDGSLSGTPAETDVKENLFVVAATNGDASANADLIITVKSANRPPKWTKNPIVLPDAIVGQNYTQSISAFATDPDGDELTITSTGGPAWVFVTTKGLVIGTPALSDLGLNKVTVQVSDGTAIDTAEVHINVVQKQQGPKWTQDPINLGTAFVAKDFSFDLRPYVTEPDGNPVSFRKAAAAPGWLKVSSAGLVTGTPQETDLGAYTTVFEVTSDNVTWVAVNAFGEVKKQVNPPKINLAALFFTVRVGEVFRVNLNQPLYVSDPDAPLKFELLTPASWVELTEEGRLKLSPLQAQLGNHSLPMRVTDSTGASAEGPIRVKVISGAPGPKWLENPIRFDAIVNKPFNADLLNKVDNPDGLPLTFTKGGGPDWMKVASSGALSGTPLTPDLGVNTFTVSVSDGVGSSSATVIVTVHPDGPDDDSVIIDEPVPGARVDNLWIVDNAWDPCSGSACIISELESSIDIYYKALARAGIHHYGIYLSSDACTYRSPIRDTRGRVLLSWDDSDWTRSFLSRIDRSPGKPAYSSSLVAIWQFLYSSVASVPSPYYEAKVPMEMLMVSQYSDKYKNFSHWAPVSGWVPNDFADYYQDELAQAKKPLRISAIAPSSTAYQTPVRATRGDYYTYGSHFDMDAAIEDYAEDVIFRAYVTAKKRIKLSKTPTDPASIKVILAGRDLASDKWTYHSGTNEVEIFWHLIDLSVLKPGDRLVIQYRI